MGVGMAAGLQGRTCCVCTCSFSPSSSSSAAPWHRKLPCLPRRTPVSIASSSHSVGMGSFRCCAEGSLDSALHRLKSCSRDFLLSRGKVANSTRFQSRAVPNSSLAERSADLGEGQEESVEEEADLDSITEWELDFCSRPILDNRGKKVWELVVCDSQLQLRFTRFYPNNIINSVTLREALMYIIQTLGVPRPQKIRFFRSQMQTIISKACTELDIQPVPSQRCIMLIRWLEERYETVYRRHPGFQEGAGPLLLSEQTLPSDVPDTLRGEQWAFVQLPLSGVLEEMAAVKDGSTFGSLLDLDNLGINLPLDSIIPGVAVASARATPLAAWTNALELASIDIDVQQACLILSSGVSDRWRYAFWRRSQQADLEAQEWEAAKSNCGGLHFLAIQKSLDAETCTGFWLLMNLPRSPV